MKRMVFIILISFCLVGRVPEARADLFGGDVAVLAQILVQAIMQLAKLKELLGAANDNLDLVREINRGINDSLGLLKTINPNIDPGIYRDWSSPDDGLTRLRTLYGGGYDSPDGQVQMDMDRGTAEAVSFSNSLYQYTGQMDELSEEIKSASHTVSPGGAEKLTAQTLGLVIQVLNQTLRAQAVGLKMTSLALASQNKRNKDESHNFIDANRALKNAMKSEDVKFEVPRF